MRTDKKTPHEFQLSVKNLRHISHFCSVKGITRRNMKNEWNMNVTLMFLELNFVWSTLTSYSCVYERERFYTRAVQTFYTFKSLCLSVVMIWKVLSRPDQLMGGSLRSLLHAPWWGASTQFKFYWAIMSNNNSALNVSLDVSNWVIYFTLELELCIVM